MKNLLLTCITCIVLVVMVAGCWNRRELNTLAIVESAGIDRTKDDSITLTVQLLKPSEVKASAGGKPGGGGGAGGKGVWVLTSSGKTVFDAYRNATLEADRKLFNAQDKIVVFGEEAARAGIVPLLDFYNRDHESRRLAYIFIARGKARDIIKGEHDQEKIPAKAIEGLAKASYANSKIPEITIHQVLKTLASKTGNPVIPALQIKQEVVDGETKNRVRLDNTAVFKRDKLIGWFDGNETRGLLWVLNKVKSGIIVVASPRETGKEVSLEIIKASSEIKPSIKNGRLVLTVAVKEEGSIGEQMSEEDLTKPEAFRALEQKQAAVIEGEIKAALTKAQKQWGVDVFKFGEAVHRKYPQKWKQLKNNWEKEFPEVEIIVEVDAKLRRSGMATKVELD